MRFNNPRHARQHFLQRRACENHSQDFENILTGEAFRQCAIRLRIGCADRLVGTMFSECHPRIIVQPPIPSLLGTYANASQAFEWLNRAYAQRDGGLVDIKVDPLLRSLHGDPRYAALLERCACHYEIHFTPPMKRNKPSGKLSPTSLRRISQRRYGFRLTCFQMNRYWSARPGSLPVYRQFAHDPFRFLHNRVSRQQRARR
jgi:hypothetical protein